MCQLTHVRTNNHEVNLILAYYLGNIGGSTCKDGCGFFSRDNGVWKTKISANLITNLGGILKNEVEKDSSISFHVRKATRGKEILDSNAHPFDGKHYILMHNGTLEEINPPKKQKGEKENKEDTDSKIFLDSLDKVTDENPEKPFLDILNETMKKFSGKFAFIIKQKESGNIYIVRGATADLFISYIYLDKNYIGYAVNTVSNTLKGAFFECVNLFALLGKGEITYTEPVLLEKESVFLADELQITKIGECKENIVYVDNYYYWTSANNSRPIPAVDSDTKLDVELAEKFAHEIFTFLDEHSLGIFDFQLLVQEYFSESILELTPEDAKILVEKIFPTLTVKKELRETVKKELDGEYFSSEYYKNLTVYPWMKELDENKILSAIVREQK
jgi:predicted glutamine amidotransferase